MKHMTKRLLALLLALLLVLPTALAETVSGRGNLDSLNRRKEELSLQLQIADLELQKAQLLQDEAAISAARDKQAAIRKQQEELQKQIEDETLSILNELESELDKLYNQYNEHFKELEELNKKLEITDDGCENWISVLQSLEDVKFTVRPKSKEIPELEADYRFLEKQLEVNELDIEICELTLQAAQLIGDQAQIDDAQTQLDDVCVMKVSIRQQQRGIANALVNAYRVQKKDLQMDIKLAEKSMKTLDRSIKALLDENENLKPYADAVMARRTLQQLVPGMTLQPQTIPEGHESVNALYAVLNASSQQTGWAVKASSPGYAGPVAVYLAFDMDGTITAARIGDSDFCEIPGFGMRWKDEPERAAQLVGLNAVYGGGIDTIVGATITSNAVLNAANAACNCINVLRGSDARDAIRFSKHAKLNNAEIVSQSNGVIVTKCKGFSSDVTVTLTLDQWGRISSLTVDSSNETPTFGGRVMESDDFLSQFIGKTIPVDDIDVLSGATITSNAVIDAVNIIDPKAILSEPIMKEPEDDPFAFLIDIPEITEEPAAELTATVPGFNDYGLGGDITVTITQNADGTIATLALDVSTQTPGFGQECGTEAWMSQFIGKSAPFVLGENIDAVAHATITSQAIVDAVNSLLPAKLTATVPGFNDYGMGGDITVTVTKNADGTVAALALDVSTQTAGFGQNCDTEEWKGQFIGKTAPFVLGENIDAVAHATITSQAIVDALNSLLDGQ